MKEIEENGIIEEGGLILCKKLCKCDKDDHSYIFRWIRADIISHPGMMARILAWFKMNILSQPQWIPAKAVDHPELNMYAPIDERV
tara:strand:- start:749 stop:1006 length:258 start_codon:yes stop_codon:yes gene_type:complete